MHICFCFFIIYLDLFELRNIFSVYEKYSTSPNYILNGLRVETLTRSTGQTSKHVVYGVRDIHIIDE